jgi:hypothetical protein
MKKVPPGEAAHFFSAGAWRRNGDPDKTVCKTRAHDPEKWSPVFGQDHAQTKTFDGRNWS